MVGIGARTFNRNAAYQQNLRIEQKTEDESSCSAASRCRAIDGNVEDSVILKKRGTGVVLLQAIGTA